MQPALSPCSCFLIPSFLVRVVGRLGPTGLWALWYFASPCLEWLPFHRSGRNVHTACQGRWKDPGGALVLEAKRLEDDLKLRSQHALIFEFDHGIAETPQS